MRKFELLDCNYLPVALDKQLRYLIYHAIYEAQVARTMRLPSFGTPYKPILWSWLRINRSHAPRGNDWFGTQSVPIGIPTPERGNDEN
jgi:hypothetical protein